MNVLSRCIQAKKFCHAPLSLHLSLSLYLFLFSPQRTSAQQTFPSPSQQKLPHHQAQHAATQEAQPSPSIPSVTDPAKEMLSPRRTGRNPFHDLRMDRNTQFPSSTALSRVHRAVSILQADMRRDATRVFAQHNRHSGSCAGVHRSRLSRKAATYTTARLQIP